MGGIPRSRWSRYTGLTSTGWTAVGPDCPSRPAIAASGLGGRSGERTLNLPRLNQATTRVAPNRKGGDGNASRVGGGHCAGGPAEQPVVGTVNFVLSGTGAIPASKITAEGGAIALLVFRRLDSGRGSHPGGRRSLRQVRLSLAEAAKRCAREPVGEMAVPGPRFGIALEALVF